MLTPAFVDNIHKHGGTILGASRGPVDMAAAVDNLIRRAHILFTVGGDGTQRGGHALFQQAKHQGHALSVVGVPKTIDNDVAFVAGTFGYWCLIKPRAKVRGGTQSHRFHRLASVRKKLYAQACGLLCQTRRTGGLSGSPSIFKVCVSTKVFPPFVNFRATINSAFFPCLVLK